MLPKSTESLNHLLRPFRNRSNYEFMNPDPDERPRPEEFSPRRTAKHGRCIVVEDLAAREGAAVTESDASWARLGTLLEEVAETKGTVFAHGDRMYGICMFGAEDEMSEKSIVAFAWFLTSFIRKLTSLQVRIGIGPLIYSYADMNRSINAAIRTLEVPPRVDRGHVLLYAESESGALLDQVKRLVEETYAETDCSLKRIAKELFVNSAYLGRMFKEKEGVSFKDYLNRVRMEKAKELLSSSDMKVYEVAFAVGYREVDWFYKKFKACTGMSTQEYRSARQYNS
ncbi:helix-turn-helix domain-containing protein [Paenibacillus antri]|uniref:Helix-turn-helix domain-containing protein n=1 Tax=Paenibacillus antri TaxID=2582848 RepID=A0A5R9G3D5_9BACL|nr:helix-turn-helix domain-containing protein [Paenibacillus antri]TLS50867.1 helix-turn-helix domain-containing protein [Paenibacillus antri]